MRMPLWLIRAITFWNTLLYRLSGGRLWRTMGNLPVIFVTAVGRKSGKSRTFPIGALRDGPNLVIAATNGGRDEHPAWYYNLKANPAARVEADGRHFNVTACEADPATRERLWNLLVAQAPTYALYPRGTNRIIPMIILEPEKP